MNKKILFSLPVLSLLCISCAGNKHFASAQYEMQLDFNKAHFNILQLSDIHLSLSDDVDYHLSFVDLTVQDAIKKCKDRGEKLNLIVLNGDIFTFADKRTVNETFSFFDKYEIPWTFTFGNHDDQGYYSDHYIEETISRYNNKYFISLDDDVSGRSNFVISLMGNVGGSRQRVYQLYFFDSHSYQFHDFMGYDYIKKDQIDWYERMLEETNPTNVKSSAFFHIPLPEYEDAKEAIADNPELNIDGVGSFEAICAPKYNSGLFKVMKRHGSTISVHVAHDHINNFAYNYDGITLCYGMKSTERIYSNEDQMGGTMISINNDYESFELTSFAHTYKEVK